MKLKLTKQKFKKLIIEEVNALTGLKEESPLEEFMLDFARLWAVLTEESDWSIALQNDSEMREEVFHAVLRHVKEELGLTRDSGAYFE